jgi:hypothetical protein
MQMVRDSILAPTPRQLRDENSSYMAHKLPDKD